MFQNYETERITHKASDAAEYIELFGSSTGDRHAWHIWCYSLNVRRYIRAVHDDLRWKNQTTHKNCRFSTMSLTGLTSDFLGRNNQTTRYNRLGELAAVN